jgi:hypothetical protein
MALKSDDSDIRKSWLRTMLGGNGDFYIEIITENEDGIRDSMCVRVSTSGGYTRDTDVKIAVAELFRAMENAGLNNFIEDDQ